MYTFSLCCLLWQCWAFSVTEQTETNFKMNGGALLELAPQQIGAYCRLHLRNRMHSLAAIAAFIAFVVLLFRGPVADFCFCVLRS